MEARESRSACTGSWLDILVLFERNAFPLGRLSRTYNPTRPDNGIPKNHWVSMHNKYEDTLNKPKCPPPLFVIARVVHGQLERVLKDKKRSFERKTVLLTVPYVFRRIPCPSIFYHPPRISFSPVLHRSARGRAPRIIPFLLLHPPNLTQPRSPQRRTYRHPPQPALRHSRPTWRCAACRSSTTPCSSHPWSPPSSIPWRGFRRSWRVRRR